MNRKKVSFFVFLFALLIQASVLSSQSLETVPKIGLGVNGLDFSFEIPVAERITVEPAIGFGPSYSFTEHESVAGRMGGHWALLEPSLHVSTSAKYFYSRNKRMLNGKSLLFNSGNFIGMKVKYVTKPLTNVIHSQNNTLLANVNWGGQRNIGRHWNYSYSVGFGYGHNLDVSYDAIFLAVDLKIAYVLPFWGGK